MIWCRSSLFLRWGQWLVGGRDGSREAGYQGVAVLPVRNGGQGRVVADAAANISVPGFGPPEYFCRLDSQKGIAALE